MIGYEAFLAGYDAFESESILIASGDQPSCSDIPQNKNTAARTLTSIRVCLNVGVAICEDSVMEEWKTSCCFH